MLGLLSLASCKSDSEAAPDTNRIAFNDFESMVGWTSGAESLSKEQAHSGKYSVKVGPETEFGQPYTMQLNKILDHKPRKLRMSGWAYMTDAKSTARLGFQLYDMTQNKEVFGDGLDYAAAVQTPGKWVQITKDITLPATTTGAQQVRVFLWRSGATSPAFIDDLSLSEVPE